ncbi:MAG TPA: adenylate/guanylate cyclase domain-containing protein, partial [Candidatus Limnocylindrales bacterium]|nr:adenylate/guanylate cyclase domain-containing protein [Candidatus Limnocylindrales bacterium]
MRCRACGAVVGANARFCEQCGTRLHAPDSSAPYGGSTIGVDPPPTARKTTRSFARTKAMASPPGSDRLAQDPSATGAAGDRRIVTALFADLVDYVRLVAEHDPEEVRRRVEGALVAMVDAIQSFDGTREKFIGDAVFAVFGWPIAHDDDALRATHCALAIRAGLARLEDPSGEVLQVRIGIATGEVVAAPREVPDAQDWSLTGPAVTTAARIQGVAQPGEILLDEATIRAARRGLAIEDLGERLLRGQTRPIRIGRLLGEAGFQPWHPLAGNLVGRNEELAIVRSALDDLHTNGRGATILVEGEAGIGKSRLLAALEQDARRLGIAWAWVDNVSYGSSEPFRFARALSQAMADEHQTDSGTFLRRMLFSPDVDPADARRWAGGIAAVARAASFSGWEAEADLAPSDPADVARDVRAAAARYFERLVEADGPRIVVVDDLHWLDPSSVGVFEELLAASARLPLLILVGSRADAARPGFLARGGVATITLTGLGEDETGELARAVAGATVEAADVQRLHARTGGNPLFIGETVRAIVDEGAITSDGRLAIGDSADSVVPVTLRALLGSRIDALSTDTRTVLRVGSVLGMSFREGTIEGVLGEPVDAAVYERLAEAAMIVPVDASGGWRFCHPLIHDAAYRSLLATDRRTLHTRVADRIEAAQPDPPIGAIARHRAAAGDADRAIPLLIRAAEQAQDLGAAAEAAAYFTSAADLAVGPTADALRERAS